ncbi:hypothetical protein HPC49_24095 [Pyxidicoccus fallax]|uniref:Lipoprotein n=1 Tax=Pyxidicoccus fallax TaxID=394095 RepID=A0A848LE88_9BACT|nr:hypothetical protein [Pyxidicoccus fallax]NMO17359.1 hypothetical protein [Pyxidicoccus fallax]NPC81297.1 hypothetical protein [Pyxidicoccus fallax]
MTSARAVLLAGLLLAASSWGREPNPARPRPRTSLGETASVPDLRAVYPDFDDRSSTVRDGALEVIQAFARRVPSRPGLRFVAILLSPPHEQTSAYHANGNYRLQVALVREKLPRAELVAKSEPVPLTWAQAPHWQQALSRIDLAAYRLSPRERALGVRVKAEYLHKLDSSKAEKLFLFREDGARLHPILETGALDCDCCPEESPSDACDCFDKPTCPRPRAEAFFKMEPGDGGTFADIVQTVGTVRVRWRFEDGRYHRQGEDPLPL